MFQAFIIGLASKPKTVPSIPLTPHERNGAWQRKCTPSWNHAWIFCAHFSKFADGGIEEHDINIMVLPRFSFRAKLSERAAFHRRQFNAKKSFLKVLLPNAALKFTF
jgi:hypothetical protein